MLLTREQLQERLIALHKASLELVKDVSLDRLLERIAAVACEQADARYAALGVLDENGKLVKFISVGMEEDEIKRISHPPVGKGLIGELMNTEKPLRVPIIQEHPRSVGFPAQPQGSGISVESDPPATVYIDGEVVGKTPYQADVEPGEIYLKLVPDGSETPFFNYETKISLSPGVKTVVRRTFGKNGSDSSGEVVSFEKIPENVASLSIISAPDAAQISIDGVVKGFTPIKISRITPGEHELTISAPGYVSKTFNISTIEKYKLTVVSKLAEDTAVASPTPVLGAEIQVKTVTILTTPTGYLKVRREPSTSSLEVGRVTPGL